MRQKIDFDSVLNFMRTDMHACWVLSESYHGRESVIGSYMNDEPNIDESLTLLQSRVEAYPNGSTFKIETRPSPKSNGSKVSTYFFVKSSQNEASPAPQQIQTQTEFGLGGFGGGLGQILEFEREKADERTKRLLFEFEQERQKERLKRRAAVLKRKEEELEQRKDLAIAKAAGQGLGAILMQSLGQIIAANPALAGLAGGLAGVPNQDEFEETEPEPEPQTEPDPKREAVEKLALFCFENLSQTQIEQIHERISQIPEPETSPETEDFDEPE